MKTLLLAVGLFGLSLGYLRADETFVMVTRETTWGSGASLLKSSVGEIEHVVDQLPDGYVILYKGHRYHIPFENARIVTAGEAALALLACRDRLNAELAAAYAEVDEVEMAPPARRKRSGGLPANWKDPREADADWRAQQLLDAINAQTEAIKQLQKK